MEVGLLVIFWYGILHAFGPDHLTAIADFSIGKNARRTFMTVGAFAIGHGVMLFAFAKVLEKVSIPENITAYGDVIASSVIGICKWIALADSHNRSRCSRRRKTLPP